MIASNTVANLQGTDRDAVTLPFDGISDSLFSTETIETLKAIAGLPLETEGNETRVVFPRAETPDAFATLPAIDTSIYVTRLEWEQLTERIAAFNRRSSQHI